MAAAPHATKHAPEGTFGKINSGNTRVPQVRGGPTPSLLGSLQRARLWTLPWVFPYSAAKKFRAAATAGRQWVGRGCEPPTSPRPAQRAFISSTSNLTQVFRVHSGGGRWPTGAELVSWSRQRFVRECGGQERIGNLMYEGLQMQLKAAKKLCPAGEYFQPVTSAQLPSRLAFQYSTVRIQT